MCKIKYIAPDGESFNTEEECITYCKLPRVYYVSVQIELRLHQLGRTGDDKVFARESDAKVYARQCEARRNRYTPLVVNVVPMLIELPTEATVQERVTNTPSASNEPWWRRALKGFCDAYMGSN